MKIDFEKMPKWKFRITMAVIAIVGLAVNFGLWYFFVNALVAK